MYWILHVLIIYLAVHKGQSFPDQTKWDFTFDQDVGYGPFSKSLFKGSKIYVEVTCNANTEAGIQINWILIESLCWVNYLTMEKNDEQQLIFKDIYDNPESALSYIKSTSNKTFHCSEHIILDEVKIPPKAENKLPEKDNSKLPKEDFDNTKNEQENSSSSFDLDNRRPIFTVTKDGIYLLILHITSDHPANDVPFKAHAHIEMKSTYGYLSAADWPYLPFYGTMSLVYVVYGLVWLIVSFSQWRDLLRIQFWIGAVILLGMLEKATFYAEYESVNITGEVERPGMFLLAEWVSCAKRALARMLVIIVSLGFGIVKPRLGSHFHKVIFTGMMYFVVAAWESYMRILGRKMDDTPLVMANLPLALLDSFICWWIFTSLVKTIRTLRLRRNVVKLTLYNHFTNTLTFAVITSVIFMSYTIVKHRKANECITDWKSLWFDEAFWHLLFSLILLVIMILWRPTNNNQRYAFSPLLDAPEDDDDEDIEQFVNEAYGVKMRGITHESPNHKSTTSNSAEDDLKWVEENIPPSLIDTPFPILDSDEEIMNTEFEISKMQ